ncbi:MAG: hypothetical protein ACE5FZ_07530 [Nitrospiria bacterium]
MIKDPNKRSGDRRDQALERRQDERRKGDRRLENRRMMERRFETCPLCLDQLTSRFYCPNCMMKVVKIRD